MRDPNRIMKYCQAFAVFECTISNAFDGVWNKNDLQICAANECIVSNAIG